MTPHYVLDFNFLQMCISMKYPYQPQGGLLEFQGGERSQIKAEINFLKESMKQNWNFQRSGGLKQNKTLCGRGMDVSGTTQS